MSVVNITINLTAPPQPQRQRVTSGDPLPPGIYLDARGSTVLVGRSKLERPRVFSPGAVAEFPPRSLVYPLTPLHQYETEESAQ